MRARRPPRLSWPFVVAWIAVVVLVGVAIDAPVVTLVAVAIGGVIGHALWVFGPHGSPR